MCFLNTQVAGWSSWANYSTLKFVMGKSTVPYSMGFGKFAKECVESAENCWFQLQSTCKQQCWLEWICISVWMWIHLLLDILFLLHGLLQLGLQVTDLGQVLWGLYKNTPQRGQSLLHRHLNLNKTSRYAIYMIRELLFSVCVKYSDDFILQNWPKQLIFWWTSSISKNLQNSVLSFI